MRGEPSESEKRSRAKSPGQTPKSSIHRNLAKLGMLDSPAKDEPIPLLEDFFNQYAEGRSLGLSEEDVRDSLAVERGIPLKEVTAELVRQATKEQDRGQKGLTKFVKAWQRGGTTPSTPSSAPRSSTAPSWEVLENGVTIPTPPSRKSSEAAPSPLRIGVPGIYGLDERKAGAAVQGDAFDEIAKAINPRRQRLRRLSRRTRRIRPWPRAQ